MSPTTPAGAEMLRRLSALQHNPLLPSFLATLHQQTLASLFCAINDGLFARRDGI